MRSFWVVGKLALSLLSGSKVTTSLFCSLLGQLLRKGQAFFFGLDFCRRLDLLRVPPCFRTLSLALSSFSAHEYFRCLCLASWFLQPLPLRPGFPLFLLLSCLIAKSPVSLQSGLAWKDSHFALVPEVLCPGPCQTGATRPPSRVGA